MWLTRKGEYAILGLLYMASREEGEIAFTRKVSEVWGLPVNFLAKIFGELAKSGILLSFKGKQGGFMLGKRPQEISLHDVVLAVEGASPTNWCLEYGAYCGQFEVCGLRDVLKRLELSALDILKSTTIADVSTSIRAGRCCRAGPRLRAGSRRAPL